MISKRDIDSIEQELESLKEKNQRQIARKKLLEEQLEKDYDCESLKEAKELLTKKKHYLEQVEEELEKVVSTLKEKIEEFKSRK